MNLINGYFHVYHHGKLYHVSADREVIYVRVELPFRLGRWDKPAKKYTTREINWNGPTGRFVRLKAGRLTKEVQP